MLKHPNAVQTLHVCYPMDLPFRSAVPHMHKGNPRCLCVPDWNGCGREENVERSAVTDTSTVRKGWIRRELRTRLCLMVLGGLGVLGWIIWWPLILGNGGRVGGSGMGPTGHASLSATGTGKGAGGFGMQAKQTRQTS